VNRLRPIVAGPWLGEFGWELMRWQGVLRRLALNGHRITMIARNGHEALYEDYVQAFVPAAALGLEEFGQTDGWRLDGRVPNLPLRARLGRFLHYRHLSALTCMRLGVDVTGSEQAFIRYQRPSPVNSDRYLVVHARATDKAGSADRNWPEDNWSQLLTLIDPSIDVIAIGHPRQSICPEGAQDHRGVPLSDTIGILSHAAGILGPSSGPMHLASLCGTPHVVWTNRAVWPSSGGTSRRRYEHDWNPLHTKAVVVAAFDWQPPVQAVASAVQELLSSG